MSVSGRSREAGGSRHRVSAGYLEPSEPYARLVLVGRSVAVEAGRGGASRGPRGEASERRMSYVVCSTYVRTYVRPGFLRRTSQATNSTRARKSLDG
jgi:hypothetical protein